MTTLIQHTLRPCGIIRKHLGYQPLIHLIQQRIHKEQNEYVVYRGFYACVAVEFDCPPHRIERNVRTLVQHAWQTNPDYIRMMAGYPLYVAPTVSEFVEIVATYILNMGTNDEKASS